MLSVGPNSCDQTLKWSWVFPARCSKCVLAATNYRPHFPAIQVLAQPAGKRMCERATRCAKLSIPLVLLPAYGITRTEGLGFAYCPESYIYHVPPIVTILCSSPQLFQSEMDQGVGSPK